MCNSIFGKGQQAVRAGQDGVRRGLTLCMQTNKTGRMPKSNKSSQKHLEKADFYLTNY
jgi:hypothetical protein